MKTSHKLSETYFYFACGIIVGGGFSIVGPSLPYLAEATNSSLDKLSSMFLIMPLGFVLGIFIFRQFAHQDWLQRFYLAAVVSHIVLLPIISYSSSFILIVMLFFVIYSGRGIISMVSNVLLLELHKPKPGPYLNSYHFCFGLGATLMPLAIGYELELTDSIRLTYLVFAAVNIPLLIFISRFKITDIPKPPPSTRGSKSMLKVLALIYIYLFAYVAVEAGYGTWIFAYMSEAEGGIISVAAAGVFTSAYWFAFTAGRLFAVFLSIYFHPIAIILSHSVLSIAAICVLILFADDPDKLWLSWIANISLGWGLAVVFPCIIYYSKDAFNIPAKVVGNYFLAALAGAMAGPWLLGQIFVIERSWIFYPMLVCTITIPATTILIFLMEKNIKRSESSTS